LRNKVMLFMEMAHKSAEQADRAVLKPTGKVVMQFKLAYEREVAMTLSETVV